MKQTKKDRALELLKTVTDGPSFAFMESRGVSVDEFRSGYRVWANSWVIEQLIELVPELQKARKGGEI